MPKAVQLNLKLTNEPGAVAKLCRDLADHGINLLALSAPDIVAKKGTVRLLVANADLARRNLPLAGYKFVEEEVLFVELKNRPGALAKTMEKLARAKINVRYIYATAYLKSQKTAAVISVEEDRLAKAHKLIG